MKKMKKKQLWYNPVEKGKRDAAPEGFRMTDMAADREGRALLESYSRMYRKKL